MSTKIAVIAILLILVGGTFFNKHFISKGLRIHESSSSAKSNSSTTPTTFIPTPKPVSTPATPNSENSNVYVTFETIYYPVSGSTESEIKSQLKQFGPVDQYGRKGDSYTDWYLKWNYPKLLSEGRCTRGPVTVSLEVKYTLPKLETLPINSTDLKTKWEKYSQNLAIHEEKHKDFAVEKANELLAKLNRVESFANCNKLDSVTNSIGEGILSEIRDYDKQYDLETDHGATQGARFP